MTRTSLSALALAGLLVSSLQAQVGRTEGMVDPSLATEAELAAVPGLSAAVVRDLLAKRPFLHATDLDAVLAAGRLSQEQRTAVYGKLWVHINLNSASKEEILLIPGIGSRMVREFEEYRPYKALVQFRREMGKYVDEAEVNRLSGYVFVPIDPTTATDEDILTIPGVGRRMLREFKEYRPWKTIEQFRREIGKYVDPKEVARLERYIVIGK
jgi:DNA uptake protein ComE-like DNA-binding protein